MNHRKIPLLMLSLLICACDIDTPNETAASTNPPSAQEASKQVEGAESDISCPSQDFGRFLKIFADDLNVQEEFTSRPLQSESVDASAEPEPKLVIRMLNGAELNFPLMPSSQQQTNDGLKISQTVLSDNEIEVAFVKEDTDYQISFFFRNDGCWTLYRMRDDSL